MIEIRKAVIPAAGLGTRFLPTTKYIPKYMLPLADKPLIQHIIEEAVACGIKKIIVITSPAKIAIEEFLHFIGNRTLIGYYIQFDIAMINRYAKKLIGTTIPNKSIELSNMYYKRYKKQSSHEFVDLKFDTIMEKLNLPKLGQHDALNDAVMSGMMYLKLKDMPEYKGAFS